MYYTFHSSLEWNESHGAAAPHLLIKPPPCQAVADVRRVKITAQTCFHHSFLQPLTAGGDITSSHQKTCLSSGILFFFFFKNRSDILLNSFLDVVCIGRLLLFFF